MRILVIGLCCMISVLAVQAKTITVCPSCSTPTIQKAIDQAVSGDEILVKAGTYQESGLTITCPLVLRGEGMPVIDGQRKGEILIIAADSVTVTGLEFQNAGVSHISDLAAIRVKRHDYFTVTNNRVINAFFGIYIENGKHGTIKNNVLLGRANNEMDSGNAIHCWYAENLTISDNLVRRYRDGIYLEFVNKSIIADNLSEFNIRYGLHFMFSNDNSYTCNTFYDNGAGVAVMFSKNISMTENLFAQNWGRSSYGLLLKEIYDAEIIDNVFQKNTIGILLEGSTRLNYQNNNFVRNGWAIQMSGGCLDNHFTKNNFTNNSLDLVVNSRVNNNTFNGNYWGEYTGYDLDHDGLGDVPHRPMKLFSHVLTEAPEAIILLRSFFVDLINFSEKVSPIFTPENVLDEAPLMQIVK
ncbi:nitrous oxide reductase family maturation protein NosD [Lewinella cohaerens]|uniref:nitrous oxide reductase family maturation protein NosD n=1 Tax=Lewinella cohaerens TaxID=70995 RepID=UPI0003A5D594|nr:nitrous oxide reductase family maturation protein NosD [Lewinella cohaerens]